MHKERVYFEKVRAQVVQDFLCLIESFMISGVLRSRRLVFAGIIVAVASVVSFFREPLYFTNPRLWAEEGAVYVQAAVDREMWDAMFAPHLGYYSLLPNVITSSGLYLCGVHGVAYFTTWCSFLGILFCVLAPLILRSEYWNTQTKQVAIIAVAILSGSAEIWVNTINLQFYFCLFTCFCLLADLRGLHRATWMYVVVGSVIASLSGATSVILLPVVVYRLWKNTEEQSVLRIVGASLCVGLGIQLWSMYQSSLVQGSSRLQLANLPHLLPGILRTITGTADAGDYGTRILFAAVVCAACIVVLIYDKSDTLNYFTKRGLFPVVLALYVGGVFTFLSLNMSGGNRYAFVPAVLMLMTVYRSIEVLPASILRLPMLLMVAVLSIRTTASYFSTANYYDPSWHSHQKIQPLQSDSGFVELPVFPQWPQTHWVIRMTDKQYHEFQRSVPVR